MNATIDVASFGPQHPGAFDFTLLFEQSILSILPSGIFLLVSIPRATWLLREKICVRSGWLLWAKLGIVMTLFCLQLALLTFWSLPKTFRTNSSLAAQVLELVDSCAIVLLLYTEHKRSIKPSILLVSYLAVSSLLDLAQARSLFTQNPRAESQVLGGLFAPTVALKTILLILEEIPKRSLLISTSEKSQDPSLESTSGPINRTVFWWLNQLFFRGFRGILRVGDLGSINEKFGSAQLLSTMSHAWALRDKRSKYALALSTFSAFKVAFLAPIIPRLCLSAFSFAQPFLINRVINYVAASDEEFARGIAGGLIGATFLIYLGLAVSRVLYNHLVYQLMTILRGALVSLIFDKSIRLDAAIAKDGAAITLMSTEIDGIATSIKDMHEIWANIIELGIAVYLLELQIGPPCFLVVIPAVVCSVLTTYASRGIGPARGRWNQGVQTRVSTTSSMLSQLKGIKMMGLADFVTTMLHNLRVDELNLSKKFRGFMANIIAIANFSDQFTSAVVIIAGVFWTRSGSFSISEAFTSLSIVYLVSGPLAQLISSLPTFLSSLTCFERIQKFLLLDEQVDKRIERRSESAPGEPIERETVIALAGASFTIPGEANPILHDITIGIPKSSCTMIIGPVGSGKSSLLKAILGEFPPSAGSVQFDKSGGPSIAFCDQKTWLRNVSVKDNIVGPNNVLDQQWYTLVINACALESDISKFPKGDATLVGSGGITLSGGQKQRVALARALYSHSDIILLDDIFSALDSATARTVFDKTIGPGGLLRRPGIAVILTTNAVHHLPHADHIVVLSKTGKLEQNGSFAELRACDGYIKDLALEEHIGRKSEDLTDNGSETQSGESQAEAEDTPTTENDLQAELSRQTGDIALYKFYLDSVGIPLTLLFIVLSMGFVFMRCMVNIWIRIWTEHGTDRDRDAYFGAYISFCLGVVIVSYVAPYFYFVVFIPKSARNLHRLLLDAVMKAPLWFLTSTDSGVTLNRFSQDMTLVDQSLPAAFFNTVFDGLTLIGSIALIASGAQYIAAVIPLCVVPLYYLQKFYLRTSRQLRHLDLEAKSPLYTHFTETLAGVVTIRALGWGDAFLQENLRHLDYSQRPYYLLFCIQRWLTVVLDLFVMAIAVVLVAFAVQFTNTTSAGAIGLAMVYIITFDTALSRMLNSWTNLETSLGAIARLRDFIRDTPQEDQDAVLPLVDPPVGWPSAGTISLDGLTSAYQSGNDSVLQDVTLKVLPGQKVGICGRTGSGKSSLLLSMLRLLETEAGSVAVDGIDLSSVASNAPRSRFTTLPQDPVTLPGTVRENLDPLGVHAGKGEDLIISALTKVKIWDTVHERGGLNTDFDTLGLSHGQQQLFSLARALLSSSQVVLLDEATSSLDQARDQEVQKVLREEFRDRTVMVVAHRLETIADMDIVIVMDSGRIVETGNPLELREQPGSMFKALWDTRHG